MHNCRLSLLLFFYPLKTLFLQTKQRLCKHEFCALRWILSDCFIVLFANEISDVVR